MKLIKLSQGQFAKVSDGRFEHLNQWKWCARWSPSTSSYYAQRTIYPEGKYGKRITIVMHRYMLGLELYDPRVGDHEDGDTLNNQDYNIRIATGDDNAKNRQLNKNSTSGLKGASWRKKENKWVAQIQSNKKKIFLGYFDTKEEAHAAYCEAAIRLHGDFARLS